MKNGYQQDIRYKEIQDKMIGSLEISVPELEILNGIVVSLFELNYSMNQRVPEELKAIREKIAILRADLDAEVDRRFDLLAKASVEKKV